MSDKRKYEVVCSKSYLDVGLVIEENDKSEPTRVLARSSTYNTYGEYGICPGMTWINTGIFLTKDEWVDITYNKPTDQILSELAIKKENVNKKLDLIMKKEDIEPDSYLISLSRFKRLVNNLPDDGEIKIEIEKDYGDKKRVSLEKVNYFRLRNGRLYIYCTTNV